MPKTKCPICGNINYGYSPRCGNCGELTSATTMIEESGPRELSPKIVRDIVINALGSQYPYDEVFNTFYDEIMLMCDFASITKDTTIHDLLSYDDGNVIRVLYDMYHIIKKSIDNHKCNHNDNIMVIDVMYKHDMVGFEYSTYVKTLIDATLRYIFKRKFIYTSYFAMKDAGTHIASSIHILILPDDNKFIFTRVENCAGQIPMIANRYDCNRFTLYMHDIVYIAYADAYKLRPIWVFPYNNWISGERYIDYCKSMIDRMIRDKIVTCRLTDHKWHNVSETDQDNKPKEE